MNKKSETEFFITLWNVRGHKDIGLMCEVFDLSPSEVLRRIRNLRYRGKRLKTLEK